MSKFKILQLDGGGLLGLIFLEFLIEVEKQTKKQIPELFDLFIGSSTGGISAAMFAKGYSAKEIKDFYIENGKKIFNERFLGFLNPMSWNSGKYDRKYIDGLVDEYLNVKMSELKKQFICTGINMKDNQYTHFFKSYKSNYKDTKLSEVVKRTYSAPTYFGYYKDNEGIWSDGGVGVHNCTLMESYIETIRQNKKNYYILSCGCGDTGANCDGTSLFSQIADFIPLARAQSIQMQINNAKELKLNFNRINVKINKKDDEMDNWKKMNTFIEYGKVSIFQNLNKEILNKIIN